MTIERLEHGEGWAGDQPEQCAEIIRFQRARIAELEALVDRLPRYQDTGEPFVPDSDDAWWIEPGRRVVRVFSWPVNTDMFWSTKQAAEAAKGGGE